MSKPDFAARRQWLVRNHVEAAGIDDSHVIDAMLAVPREAFVSEVLWESAYEDEPLDPGDGRTMPQPGVVARMIAAMQLQGGERVLEIGTGSGYAAALLSRIAARVYTVEPIAQTAEKAASTLGEHGFDNVHVMHGEENHGWTDHAPYDAILIAEARPAVPKALLAQLRIGGRLVAAVGVDPDAVMLIRMTCIAPDEYDREDLGAIRVPLLPDFGELDPNAVHARPRRASES